jgi:hypothetical protein
MKTFALCVVCGGLAFAVVQYQMTGQLFGFGLGHSTQTPPPPGAKFPETLAVACRGGRVPEAAAFDKKSETHPAVILKPNGTLHDWHGRLQQGWQAETVEETELVVIVPRQKKTLLQIQTYANGAPPIKRWKYEVDVRVLEAHTGKTVAFRHFESVPRPLRPMEVWDLTELGDPVPWRDVSRWLQRQTSARPESSTQ